MSEIECKLICEIGLRWRPLVIDNHRLSYNCWLAGIPSDDIGDCSRLLPRGREQLAPLPRRLCSTIPAATDELMRDPAMCGRVRRRRRARDVMVAVADYPMPARALRGYKFDLKLTLRHGLTWAPDGRPSVDAPKAYKRPMSQRRTHFLIFEFWESSIDWSPRRV